MQREEGFNTKMADGPDEYDTEAGCVPLLHPEVRGCAERVPPSAPLGPSPPDSPRAVVDVCRVMGRAGLGGGWGDQSRPERGCERITGEEIAGRSRPGRALGRCPWPCLEDRGWGCGWFCPVAATARGCGGDGAWRGFGTAAEAPSLSGAGRKGSASGFGSSFPSLGRMTLSRPF
jgi:hypothetical protein